jgi:hypothetical protein
MGCVGLKQNKRNEMKDIVIKQVGFKCQVNHGDNIVFRGGRVEAKRKAKELHHQTGDPVWNWKNNNTRVEVQYRQPAPPL